MLIIPDATLLVQIINFVLFWSLLNLLFIRPTQRAIELRLRYVAGQYEEADGHAAEAAEINARARAVLSEAARRAELVLKDASARAAKETTELDKESAAEAAAVTEAARMAAAAERERAATAAMPLVDELARDMVAKALGPLQMAYR